MSAEPLSREERMKGEMHHSLWVHRYEATVRDVEAKLADCERRERAAVERAEAAEKALMIYGEHVESCALHPGAPCTCGLLAILETIPEYQALAADDEARAT